MGRRSGRRTRARRADRAGHVERLGRAITDVASIPKRLDDRVRPYAQGLGWIGVAALAACLWLRTAPAGDWPFGLGPDDFPVCVTVSLVAASLLGWAFMQEGQARIERRVGRGAALLLFVFLPLAAAAAGVVDDRAPLASETRAEWSAVFSVARWYSPAAVVASLGSFFAAKAVRGRGLHVPRAILYAALLAPFAVLLAALVFGFRFPWIAEPLHETLSALGGGAVAVQIVLAWFVGAAG